MRIILAAYLLSRSAFAYEPPEINLPLKLPACPPGAEIVCYTINPDFIGDKDLQDYLESLGIQFPKRGFAIFLKPQQIALIATTRENHNLICKIPSEETLKIHTFIPLESDESTKEAEQDAAANP
jgi:hypothetical protein